MIREDQGCILYNLIEITKVNRKCLLTKVAPSLPVKIAATERVC
jgi:hypothetical protein